MEGCTYSKDALVLPSSLIRKGGHRAMRSLLELHSSSSVGSAREEGDIERLLEECTKCRRSLLSETDIPNFRRYIVCH